MKTPLASLALSGLAASSWLAFSLPSLPAAESAPPPPGIQFNKDLNLSDGDRAVLEAFVGHAVNFAGKQTAEGVKAKCLKSPESFAWVDFRALNCLNLAYELTGDTAYLDRLRDTFKLYREAMSTGPDKYLGWYGSPIPPRIPKDNPDIQIDEIQANFRGVSMLAKWVELAKSNPAYAEANAAVIKDYLDLLENHLVPKWDARGFYADVEKGGVYRGMDYPIEGGGTLSHEKLSIMVDGLLNLYAVTQNPAYLKRALQVGAWFKASLSLKDGHYEWMSWCPAGKWDVSPDKPDAWKVGWIAPDPNAEWYVAALSIALRLYQYGLLFDDQDLQRFLKTQKEMCWNGDLEKPEYRTVAGVSPAESKFVKGRFLSNEIAQYDPTLRQLAFSGPNEAEAVANAGSDWKGGINAQSYVREKYLRQPILAKDPKPFRQLGEQFLADPENRAFYEKLAFEVEAPGAVTPLKPSQATFLANP